MTEYVKNMKESLLAFFLSPAWQERGIDGRRRWIKSVCRDIGYGRATNKELRELADFIWDESCKGILRGLKIDYDKKNLLKWIKEGLAIREKEKIK